MLLALILAFSLLTRVWNLDYPRGYYFDEVYNAFTAREFVKGNKAAYEWFHQSPVEGTAYGWTHPPLAKLLGAMGILVFGDNEFGWRIANSVIGVGVIYLVYLIGRSTLNARRYAVLAAALAASDGLLLVQSRINMNDIVATFFILLSFLAFIHYQLRPTRYSLLTLGLILGLLVATKWTGFYALALFGTWTTLKIVWDDPLRTSLKGSSLFVALVMIPAAVYLLSYSQYFVLGGSWANFVELQKQMWWYNTRLEATHTYQSDWWTWPLDLRPVWYFVDYSRPGYIANIYALGNPLLWWLGIPAVVFTLYHAVKKRDWKLGIVVVGYLAFWLPWARAPRIMFLYHYLPSVPFLAISLAYALSRLPRSIKLTTTVLTFAFCILSFVYFFPHWTGIHIPSEWVRYYYWLPSWK